MTPTTNTNDRKPSIILIIVIVIAAIFLLPRLFNNNTAAPTTTIPSQPQESLPNDTGTVQLGAPVSASGIDSNGCATETQSTFFGNESIYVVAPDSTVSQGTSLFVRLYRDGTAIEDAPQITANQDYSNNCINFVFQPTGADFTPGSYEAQFFVNGNAGPSVTFNVQ